MEKRAEEKREKGRERISREKGGREERKKGRKRVEGEEGEREERKRKKLEWCVRGREKLM